MCGCEENGTGSRCMEGQVGTNAVGVDEGEGKGQEWWKE